MAIEKRIVKGGCTYILRKPNAVKKPETRETPAAWDMRTKLENLAKAYGSRRM